ncbi:MAG: D-arabinono-1,4-lactone oxidase, partial [Acidimicrobiales bacterium]
MSPTTKPWRNWAGNQVCLPAARAQPRSTDEVAAIVAAAHAAGRRVKVFGAGHSFTAAACTDGVLMSLDHLDAIESVDRPQQRVTVQAGIRLHALNDRLAELGLAMPNLGDIAYQSIAGAIATATHGTGAELGNLATTVVGMELVTGTGEVIWCDQHIRRDLWTAARVGVGALGIVTKVSLQCVPAFNLHAVETKEPLDDLLGSFAEDAAANDHFEFFWMPGARNCQVKRNNSTDRPAEPSSRVTYVREKILAENVAFGLVNRVGRRFPTMAPRVAKMVSAGVAERDFVDRSDKVFASPRLVKFYEMEYGLPVEVLPEALDRIRGFMTSLAEPIMFPIEVRVSAGDDIPLSTAEGRASGWLAFHVYQGTSYESYFAGVETILDDYDGRPHWGKLHFQNHHTLQSRYPRWAEFAAARAEL